jgi:hypothetical protein
MVLFDLIGILRREVGGDRFGPVGFSGE